MRRDDRNKRGTSTVELALSLPMLAMMLFLLIEGANVMHTYSELMEASREGARMVLRDGENTNVQSFVESLLQDLDGPVTATVSTGSSNMVTVEVSYDYQPFPGHDDILEYLFDYTSTEFRAKTSMPLP